MPRLQYQQEHTGSYYAASAEYQQRKFSYQYQLLDRQQTAELIGSDADIGGMTNMHNGHVDADAVALGMLYYRLKDRLP